MRIFIDTNKYLDFYRASDHSLIVLKILIGLIESGKIELILPRQVLNEFIRDKDVIFNSFIQENFRDIKTPGFLSGENKKISKVNDSINKIKADYEKKFYSPRSKINIALKKVFSLAVKENENMETLSFAQYRTLRGNPPRKGNNSFGDAIIWETLLSHYVDQDIIIISGDSDFSSDRDKSQIHPFLKDEWFERGGKKVELFQSLGQFINQMTKSKTKIKKEVIEEETSLSTIHYWPNQLQNTLLTGTDLGSQPISLSNIGLSAIYGQQSCQCCGKILNNPLHMFSLNNRCSDCSDVFSTPRNCGKCGKHFHESYLSTAYRIEPMLNFTNAHICPDCKKES